MVNVPTGILAEGLSLRGAYCLFLCLKGGHIQKEKYIMKQLCAKNPKTLRFVMLKIEFVFLFYKSSVKFV